ncbi:MAG: YHS domain-containing protein [candidate division WOR-3 bacterium]
MKPLLLTIISVGLVLTGAGSAPPQAQQLPCACLNWLQSVKIEVTQLDSGAVIKLFADNPAALKMIQDYVGGLTAAASPTAKDPVCGMDVNRAQATEEGLTAGYQGTTYFFCSAKCRGDFMRQPAKFAPRQAPAGSCQGCGRGCH